MVIYEWDCETVAACTTDEYEQGDCIDHSHGATFKEVREWADRNPPQEDTTYMYVLVRDDDNGRSWAYVEQVNGVYVLPEWFTESIGDKVARVPAKYHKEIACYNSTHKNNTQATQ